MPRYIVESDSSEESDNDALSTLLHQIKSPKRLKEALRKLEVQNNELRATNKRQQQQLADKENAEEEPNVAGRKKRHKTKSGSGSCNTSASGVSLSKADEEALIVIASKFTYMSCFWLRQLEFTFKLEKDEDYDPATRFANTMSKCQGQLQDLLKVIPREWYELMKNKSFFSLFREAMSQQRSNACKRVRRDTVTAIFNCTDQDLETSRNRFEKFSVLIGWTEKDGKAFYDPFAPILYKEDNGEEDRDRIFRNPILLKTMKALIQGPSSVKGGTFSGSRGTLQSKWGIEAITPGAIAMCAILARFSLSADEQLQPKGVQTKIDYLGDFETYYKYMIEGLRGRKKSVINLIKHWNDFFFDTNSQVKNVTGQVESSRVCQAFRGLEDDSEIENSAEEAESHNERASNTNRNIQRNKERPTRPSQPHKEPVRNAMDTVESQEGRSQNLRGNRENNLDGNRRDGSESSESDIHLGDEDDGPDFGNLESEDAEPEGSDDFEGDTGRGSSYDDDDDEGNNGRGHNRQDEGNDNHRGLDSYGGNYEASNTRSRSHFALKDKTNEKSTSAVPVTRKHKSPESPSKSTAAKKKKRAHAAEGENLGFTVVTDIRTKKNGRVASVKPKQSKQRKQSTVAAEAEVSATSRPRRAVRDK